MGLAPHWVSDVPCNRPSHSRQKNLGREGRLTLLTGASGYVGGRLRRTLEAGGSWLMGWFGIRGIGSLYYLSYALSHGVSGPAATELAGVTISVVAASILLHGTSARPLLSWYERRLSERREK